jgi:hypothetical protein
MRKIALVFAVCTLLGVATPAWAVITVWDFGAPTPAQDNTAVGATSVGVTQRGVTLTAYGFNANNTGHLLYYKNAGVDEHGLGLVGTNDNELTLTNINTIANYMQIDASPIYLTAPAAGTGIRVQSVTAGEKWDLFGSNTLGSIGTLLNSGLTADNTFFTPLTNWGTYKYYAVAVHTPGNNAADNVLFDAIEANVTITPEPATWIIWTVLGGVGLVLGRWNLMRKTA